MIVEVMLTVGDSDPYQITFDTEQQPPAKIGAILADIIVEAVEVEEENS